MQIVCASRFFLFRQTRKYEKLSTRGRESRYLRPRVALPSAASSITFGRESLYQRPRVDID